MQQPGMQYPYTQQPGTMQPGMQQPGTMQPDTQNHHPPVQYDMKMNPLITNQVNFVENTEGKKTVLGHGAKNHIHIRQRDSVEMECFKCSYVGYTDVNYVNGATVKYISLILFLQGFCLFLPWFFCCIPCCIKDLKDVHHRCSKCKTHIATQDRYAVFV